MICSFARGQLEWWIKANDKVLPDDINDIIKVDDIEGNPLRNGAGEIIWNFEGEDIIGPEDDVSFDTSLEKTLDLIKKVINYALWLLALIALIYLIYHGILMLVNQGDDAIKKWLEWLKVAVIALAGIALSWLIVSLIFKIIGFITT